MILRRFQQAGHRPIAVVGGATGMIGDPSGKSEERKLLSVDALRANVDGDAAADAVVSDFDAAGGAILVNNYDWMSQFRYLDFLRDVGKNFPVNVMLAKDSVRARLEREDSGLSFTEFSYMLLQAYDFVHLKPDAWLRIANRRQRSMGKHHRWDRPRPTDGRSASVRHDRAAADQERRRQDGKNRERRHLARPGADQPLPVLSVLAECRRRRRRQMPALFHGSDASQRSKGSTRPAPPILGKRESQRRLAEDFTRLVHGEAGSGEGQAGKRNAVWRRDLGTKRRGIERDFCRRAEPATCRYAKLEAGLPVLDAFISRGSRKAKATPAARSKGEAAT